MNKPSLRLSDGDSFPDMKDGVPVPILSTIEVNFRCPEIWFDAKAEEQRTQFNLSLRTFNRSTSIAPDIGRAVEQVLKLSWQKFPPAMYLEGMWKTNGEHEQQGKAEGLALIERAAARHCGPAIYEMAARHIQGRDFPQDREAGLRALREAAMLGSVLAQLEIGDRYRDGNMLAADPDRARQNYRLCASKGIAACQYRLARSLFDQPNRTERDYLQALAWFRKAAAQKVPEAVSLLESENPKLTAEQKAWVDKLSSTIMPK